MSPLAAGRRKTLMRVYAGSQIAGAALLVIYIVASLLLVGGRVAQTQDELWPAVLEWPVFAVPGWLSIVLASVGALTVVPLAVMTPAERAPTLLGAFGPTFAAGVAAFVFMGMFPAESGPFPLSNSDEFLGSHGIALALTAVCAVVLIVAIAVKTPQYERLRKSGKLPVGGE